MDRKTERRPNPLSDLRALRLRARMTTRQAARIVGVSHVTIVNWETEMYAADPSSVKALTREYRKRAKKPT